MHADYAGTLFPSEDLASASIEAGKVPARCGDRGLLYEEAPEAYKAIDSVVGALREAGLLRVLARLKPVLTYKTRGECC